MILLDTHVLVWLDAGVERFGDKSRELADRALVDGHLAVSAISFWEIAMLIEKGRLRISMTLDAWRADLLAVGLQELAVTGEIGIQGARLAGFHGDPADRLIVATALQQGARLMTADTGILRWPGNLETDDARS